MTDLAITGAAGFIGRHCVAEARRQNIPVRAFVRRLESAPPDWQADSGITVVALDLAQSSDALADALKGAQTLIHCAATLSGDQIRDTLTVSRRVIDAVVAADVPHVVLAGSFDVYDVRQLADHAALTEACPTGPAGRTDYANAKHAQETMFDDGAALYGFALSTLRLGAVWGPEHLFNAHVGPAVSSLLMMIDGGGTLPLCRVELAATMLVRAAQTRTGVGIVNVVDDDLPDRRRYVTAFRVCGWPKATMRIPLRVWRLFAAVTPDIGAMPGLLRSPILETRHRPLTYDNTHMHKILGPVEMVPFETAMQTDIDRQQQVEAP
ncbi:NAD(P)-dependent oxidoreductase [Shimia sp. R9_3]|uniref:NAD-dependent epimerase/dehydratase family protein n=1 Tax=Shimia sp. R9_3 TaxID=2821113 RepID=UPI001AD99AA0|nr:NAD(P)-dependent oxidoreductase [Shimia sp. R9_3]MBO9400963.1 NAD(P)-dependent oxidoreductase [Shimia sp. R9_3]